MKYIPAVDEYLSLCRASGKSPNTLDSYARTLHFFGSYLTRHGIFETEDITPAVLASWKGEAASSVSPASLRLYVTHLKGFFDFCVDIEYVSKNPFKKKLMEVAVKDTDRKDTTSHVLTASQFRRIFENDSPRGTHRKAIARNRAILALAITSGIRCQSLCDLRLSDLDAVNHCIHLRNAKGGKNGEILMSSLAWNAVSDYLHSDYLPPEWFQNDDPFFGFVDASGIFTPYCREQMSAIIESAVRGFVGVSGFRAHSMRHTCASLLSAGGMTDGEISTLLMHSDGSGAQVTNRYIDRDNRALFVKADSIFRSMLGTHD